LYRNKDNKNSNGFSLAPIVVEINFVKVFNFDKVIVTESGKRVYKWTKSFASCFDCAQDDRICVFLQHGNEQTEKNWQCIAKRFGGYSSR